jgi:predicted ATPase/DNA-binding SARP family transcriptional activator
MWQLADDDGARDNLSRRGARIRLQMLHLLDTPCWETAGTFRDLPDTLPGWSVAFLSVQCDWVGRERLFTLLWPDATAIAAQHNLRVNLYRVRALLDSWGVGAALKVERRRVCLDLPTDVAAWRRELVGPVEARSLERYRQPFLAGMNCAAFPALDEWVRMERASLHTLWRNTTLAVLAKGQLATDSAIELCRRLLVVDPLDEEVVAQQMRTLIAAGRVHDAHILLQYFGTQLRNELGVEPPTALQALVIRHEVEGSSHGAPARHVFVGRARELGQLEAMLSRSTGRVVTLHGPGGVGKSRLAHELAERLSGRWRDGMAWVHLANLSKAAAALPLLAAQVNLAPSPERDIKPQLLTRLGAHEGLIVCDNAEHLAEFPALLAELCSASPASTWLVTSRVALEIADERTFALEGLAGPEADAVVADLEEALSFEAMSLFVARSRAADADFDIATQWRSGLELVRLTGGWPLAIELAAGALAHLDINTLLADLRLSVDALASGVAAGPPRHQSIRASLDLSWQLLEPEARRVLAGLGVFRGPFTRPGALAVTAGDSTVFAKLLARSLVQVQGGGRYKLHPLVSQFANNRLDADADTNARASAEQRHAEYFAARAGMDGTALARDETDLLDEIELDFENFRAAWQTLVGRGDGTRIGPFAAAWSNYGTVKGRSRELSRLVAAALRVERSGTPAHSALLQAAANLHYRCGELDAAQALARDALAAARDDRSRIAMFNTLALALKDLGQYDEAHLHSHEALRLARTAGSDRQAASSANTCAILAKMRGDYAGAAALYGEALAIHRRGANHRGLAICLNNLGNVHRALGERTQAQACFEECVRVTERHGIASTHAYALVNLALVHHEAGRGSLARSFAQRARAAPAAEIAVLLAAQTVLVLGAVENGELDAACVGMRALAEHARKTGLHAALLDTVQCHAKLLVAMGRRADALARFAFLAGHPQLPAMQRGDVERALERLAPTAEEHRRAATTARALALDLLVDDAIAVTADAQTG